LTRHFLMSAPVRDAMTTATRGVVEERDAIMDAVVIASLTGALIRKCLVKTAYTSSRTSLVFSTSTVEERDAIMDATATVSVGMETATAAMGTRRMLA
jgi:hypothetical protein